MTLIALVGILALVACASGQQQNYLDYSYQGHGIPQQARQTPPNEISRASAGAKPTPVPIIKQINRHNDDGSYTYGYEGADGSFKIETKLPTGEVSGKYGYVDDTGKLRVVDYGANRYGFQPAGEGITVAPPTLVDETTDPTKQELAELEEEQAALYARGGQLPPGGPHSQPHQISVARPVTRQQKRPRPAPRPVQYAPQPQPQPQFIYDQSRSAPAPTQIPIQHLQHVPQQIPQHTQQQIPQHIQQQIPQHLSQQIPQQIPQLIQQQSPAQFPQTIIYEGQPRGSPTPRVPHAVAHSTGPVPPRVVVPGSHQAGPLFRPHSLPAPVSSPVAAPAQRPPPVREPHVRPSGPSGSVLDSLIQQYALPQGVGQPLHDITFGSYAR